VVESTESGSSSKSSNSSSSQSAVPHFRSRALFRCRAPPPVDTGRPCKCGWPSSPSPVHLGPALAGKPQRRESESPGGRRSPLGPCASPTMQAPLISVATALKPPPPPMDSPPTLSPRLASTAGSSRLAPTVPAPTVIEQLVSSRRSSGHVTCLNSPRLAKLTSTPSAAVTVWTEECAFACMPAINEIQKACTQSSANESAPERATSRSEVHRTRQDGDVPVSRADIDVTYHISELVQAVKYTPPTSVRNSATVPWDAKFPCNFQHRARLMEEAYKGITVRPTHPFSHEHFRVKCFNNRSQAISWPGCPPCFARNVLDGVGHTDASTYQPKSDALDLAASDMSDS